MKEGIFRKGLIVGIFVIFLGASIIPIISSSIGRTSSVKLKISSSSMNCYAYGETWNKESSTVLSQHKINEIYTVFNELKNEIIYDPLSDETQSLKIEFIDLLDENGLIQDGYSKDDYVSLLNPSWLNGLQNINLNNVFNELKYAMSYDPLSKNTQILKMKFVNLLDENGLMPKGMSKINLVLSLSPSLFGGNQNTGKISYSKNALSTSVHSASPYADSGTSVFCSMGSSGSGIVFPFVMLPRPRIVTIWEASDAVTTVANMFTQKGFIAGGGQHGVSVGFLGIGLAFVFPGEAIYGFVGYSLLTTVNADFIENYPPNIPPIISNENPPNWAYNISVTLPKLSFRIEDPDSDRMSYSVTTEPDIGSGSGNNKGNGVYTVPINGLEPDKIYIWSIEVTDGKDTIIKEFTFFTGESTPYDMLFFDDFDDNSKNYSKWTEIFGNGTWDEINQRIEFQVLESIPHWEKEEGIKSSPFSVSISSIQSVRFNCTMISNIESTSSVGYLYFEISDGTHWIRGAYRIGYDRLQFQDSNDADYTILGTRGDSTWSNTIEVFSDKYRVIMDSYDSGWIYDSLFFSNPTLDVKIYVSNGGTNPPLYQRSGFDDVMVQGSQFLPLLQ
jgi:hypothetical protein